MNELETITINGNTYKQGSYAMVKPYSLEAKRCVRARIQAIYENGNILLFLNVPNPEGVARDITPAEYNIIIKPVKK